MTVTIMAVLRLFNANTGVMSTAPPTSEGFRRKGGMEIRFHTISIFCEVQTIYFSLSPFQITHIYFNSATD